MVVEVYMRDSRPTEEQLPDTILELESLLGEVRPSYEKLKESTDILTDECRKATDESEAREYYTYIQENLEILEAKAALMVRIQSKINQLRGVFPSAETTQPIPSQDQQESDSGHFI